MKNLHLGLVAVAIALSACGGGAGPAPVTGGTVVAPSAAVASTGAGSAADAGAPLATATGASDPSGAPVEECHGRATPLLVRSATEAARHAKRCYTAALAGGAGVSGTMKVEVRLSSDGRVEHARVKASTFPPPMNVCVEETLAKETFAAPEDGCVVVNIPLRFLPNDDSVPIAP